MEKHGASFSKVMLTPDPHHIPGYAGYCPQLKYNMGRTYGQLTAELLSRTQVSRSGPLVQVQDSDLDSDSTMRLRGERKKMIPGYTGFVPRSRSYFACSFSETCRKALSEFHRETKRRSMTAMDDYRETPRPPLTPISNKVVTYRSLQPLPPTTNPYSMDDDNPHKFFISGFTGHVPKSRFLIGKGFPVTTNQALIQFRRQQQRGRERGRGVGRTDPQTQDSPERRPSPETPMPSIYPSDRGVVPSFTGHIPGYQFMYGHTYGQLSQNALLKSGIRRSLHA